MRTLTKSATALLAVAMIFISTSALAISISGTIGFGGDWTRTGNTIDLVDGSLM